MPNTKDYTFTLNKISSRALERTLKDNSLSLDEWARRHASESDIFTDENAKYAANMASQFFYNRRHENDTEAVPDYREKEELDAYYRIGEAAIRYFMAVSTAFCADDKEKAVEDVTGKLKDLEKLRHDEKYNPNFRDPFYSDETTDIIVDAAKD